MSIRKRCSNDTSDVSIQILSDDCLESIFSFLDHWEQFGVERVCRRWREVSRRCLAKKKSINIKEIYRAKRRYPAPLQESNLRQIFSLCCKGVHTLEIGMANRWISNFETFQLISEFCENLKDLSMTMRWDCVRFPPKFLELMKNLTKLSIMAPDNCLDNCLTNLLAAAENLDVFQLIEAKTDGSCLMHLSEKCTYLELLNVQSTRPLTSGPLEVLKRLTKLEVLKVWDSEVNGLINLMDLSNTCRCLDFNCPDSDPVDINPVLRRLTNLQILQLTHKEYQIHPSTLRPSGESLKDLYLPKVILTSDDRDVWPWFANLRRLYINKGTLRIDQVLLELTWKCPKLEELDISGTSCGLSGLKIICQYLHLKHLTMCNCMKMDDTCLKYFTDRSCMKYYLESFRCKSVAFSHNTLVNFLKQCPELTTLRASPPNEKGFIKEALKIVQRRHTNKPLNLYMAESDDKEYRSATGKLVLKVISAATEERENQSK